MRTAHAFLLLAILTTPAYAPAQQQTLTGALITHPVGAYVRYDVDTPLGYGVDIGLFNEFLFYSNQVGVQLGVETTPAWLKLTLDLGVDPGVFLKLSPDEPYREDGKRDFGVRYLVRPQLLINLRSEQWWLYSRTTGIYRHRGFREADTFQGIALGNELSVEQAYALMRRVGRTGPRATWLYIEHTVGHLRSYGIRPNRISGGVITERWPWSNAILNLDLYYSLAAPPLSGPGALLTWVVTW